MTNMQQTSYSTVKTFPLRSGTWKEWLLSLLYINIVLKVLIIAIRGKKEIKGIQVGEVKLPLFLDDMMLLTENTKDATSKLFEFISEFGKAAGYKTNILKSVAFPYTNNKKKIKRRD